MSSISKPPVDLKKLFYENLKREYVCEFLKNYGDFLLRRGEEGVRILSVKSRNDIKHFRFSDVARTITMDGIVFDSLESMIGHYYNTGAKFYAGEVELLTPILSQLDLIDFGSLTLVQELGRGNFGQVWRATLPVDSGQGTSTMTSDVAVKILAQNTSDKERDECLQEAKLMNGLEHENIVKLKGLSFWKESDAAPPKMLIVLEYCGMGSLDKLLEKDMVQKKGKRRALVEAAHGIAFLHDRSIIHRDIACRNCLVHKGPGDKFTVKIGDFGLSRKGSPYRLVTKRRLPIFSTPPETLRYRIWNATSDVWSFGVLMQEVYNAGKNPYEKHYGKAPLKQIVLELLGGFRLSTPSSMPPDLVPLSMRCLAKEETGRPTMKQVADELTTLVDSVR